MSTGERERMRWPSWDEFTAEQQAAVVKFAVLIGVIGALFGYGVGFFLGWAVFR